MVMLLVAVLAVASCLSRYDLAGRCMQPLPSFLVQILHEIAAYGVNCSIRQAESVRQCFDCVRVAVRPFTYITSVSRA